ncbi:MAG TPA: class I SAM-dependent methyltransferase [Anaerolineae bacterium]|nr:class I SAM-dependent methyltransferase [Anaerolineae bacterium]HQH39236.1 class I SAM-dependent methyltransferase [Anaerolineae bacterium]
MAPYNAEFAHVYDLYWGGWAKHVAPRIWAFYESTSPEPINKTALDVCCGTGQLALYLLEHGYNVTGLDFSPAMLRYAIEKAQPYIDAGRARFVEGDAADFMLDGPFGLAISTYDALNHLPDMAALRGCFRSVGAVLSAGGRFIFDLNTRRGLQHWAGASVQMTDDLALFTRGVWVEEQNRAYTQISGFLRRENGLYDRFDQTAFNTLFEMSAVHTALLDAGFRSAYGARLDDLAMPLDDLEAEPRVFFVAEK